MNFLQIENFLITKAKVSYVFLKLIQLRYVKILHFVHLFFSYF